MNLEVLYNRHAKPLYSFVLLRCGDPHLAEDICSQVWVEACARALDDTAPRAWLYTVARHRLIDHYRSQRRWRTEPLTERSAIGDNDAVIDRLDARAYLRTALPRLSRRQRIALVLRYGYGLSTAEVAWVMGDVPNTSKTLLWRARTEARRT